MNNVILSGRLTKDIEVKYTQSGSSVSSFTVACDRRVKRGDEYKPEADFIRCVAFGKTAEFLEKYFSKGSFIIIRGSIKTGSYEDKDGKKVYTTDVWVDSMGGVEFGGGKSEGTKSETKDPSQAATEGFMAVPDDLEDEGLPFL